MGTNPKTHIATPTDSAVARNGVKLQIHWNPSFAPGASAALQRTQTKFDHEFVRMTDKYVPFDSGTLKHSAITATDFGSGEPIYSTPYAAAQYYRHELGQGIHDGVRGPHWGERSIADNKEHFEAFAQSTMKEEMSKR